MEEFKSRSGDSIRPEKSVDATSVIPTVKSAGLGVRKYQTGAIAAAAATVI
jgi:hypothetical protein